jgi:hypothetical protein
MSEGSRKIGETKYYLLVPSNCFPNTVHVTRYLLCETKGRIEHDHNTLDYLLFA